MARRTQYLAATALAPPPALGWWPGLLLAAPLALAPVGAGAVTIGSSCKLSSGNSNQLCLVSTVLSGDTIAFDGGALQMDTAGPATYANDGTISSKGGTINQGGNINTLSGIFSNVGSITIANVKSSDGSQLTAGSVTFSGVNTYTGATTIDSGATLKLSGSGSIASSSGLADSGTFDISGLTAASATIKNLTGSGTVMLGSKTLTLANTAPSIFDGKVTGTGGVTVSTGTQTLTGSTSDYTGATTINSGATLALTGSGTVATSSGVAANGAFDLSNAAAAISITSLSGAGSVTLKSGQTLTLSNASGTFSGAIGEAGKSGNLAITKGTEVLTGANTYTGTTTVGSASPATLVLNGSLKSATTTVAAGSTLTGVGSTSGNVVNSGTIKPFNTVTSKTGTLAIGGNLTQSGAASVLDFVFDTGGAFSKVSVGGTAALAGTLAIDTINSFLFPKATTQYNSLLGSVGATSGDFTNMTYNGAPCTGGNDVWVCQNITFHNIIGAAGVSIQARRAPEPATLALLGTGVVGLLALRRRRA